VKETFETLGSTVVVLYILNLLRKRAAVLINHPPIMMIFA